MTSKITSAVNLAENLNSQLDNFALAPKDTKLKAEILSTVDAFTKSISDLGKIEITEPNDSFSKLKIQITEINNKVSSNKTKFKETHWYPHESKTEKKINTLIKAINPWITANNLPEIKTASSNPTPTPNPVPVPVSPVFQDPNPLSKKELLAQIRRDESISPPLRREISSKIRSSNNECFLFQAMLSLTEKHPQFLVDYLKDFPLKSSQDKYTVAMNITDSRLRQKFALHFGINSEELTNARETRANNAKTRKEVKEELEGYCLGHTMSLISQKKPDPTISPETLSKIKFIQKTSKQNAQTQKTTNKYIKIGKYVLKRPETYSMTLQSIVPSFDQTPTTTDSTDSETSDSDLIDFEKKQNNLYYLAGRAVWHNPENKKLGEAEKDAINNLKQNFHNNINDIDETLPFGVLKSLELKEVSKIRLKEVPINELSEKLRSLKNDQNKHELCLKNRDGSRHAMYLNFNSPSFCDNNDIDHILQPVLRQFENCEEMLSYLQDYLEFTYPSTTSFSVTSYMREPNKNSKTAIKKRTEVTASLPIRDLEEAKLSPVEVTTQKPLLQTGSFNEVELVKNSHDTMCKRVASICFCCLIAALAILFAKNDFQKS